MNKLGPAVEDLPDRLDPQRISLTLLGLATATPLTVLLALRGHSHIAIVAAIVATISTYLIIVGARSVAAARRQSHAAAPPSVALAAVRTQVGPPPANVKVGAMICYILATTATVAAAVLTINAATASGLSIALGVFVATITAYLGLGWILAAHRLLHVGDIRTPRILSTCIAGIAASAVPATIQELGNGNAIPFASLIGVTMATAAATVLPARGRGRIWLVQWQTLLANPPNANRTTKPPTARPPTRDPGNDAPQPVAEARSRRRQTAHVHGPG
jgi:hypothetical protein